MSLPNTNLIVDSTPLRPGHLVFCSVQIKGGVKYDGETIEARHIADDGSERERWEKERIIFDPAEYGRAVEERSAIRSLIAGACVQTAFSLLCPDERLGELAKAHTEAKRRIAAFNETTQISKLVLNYITGRVAPDDETAIASINAKVRELLSDMQESMKALDVAKMREAANEAKRLGEMLSDNAQLRIQEAIDGVRKVARDMTKAAKAGEQVALAIDNQVLANLTNARTAFLDIDTPVAADNATPAIEGRAVDLTSEPEKNAAPQAARDLELS